MRTRKQMALAEQTAKSLGITTPSALEHAASAYATAWRTYHNAFVKWSKDVPNRELLSSTEPGFPLTECRASNAAEAALHEAALAANPEKT